VQWFDLNHFHGFEALERELLVIKPQHTQVDVLSINYFFRQKQIFFKIGLFIYAVTNRIDRLPAY
jgi:hypothetical protein